MKKILFVLFCFFTANVMIACSFAAGLRVACVGDSITAGSGVPSQDNYPSQLRSLVGTEISQIGNFGYSGNTLLRKGDQPYWTTMESQTNSVLTFQPDIVFIMLGTNDSKPQNWAYKSEFQTDYRALVTRLRALPSRPVVVAMLPIPAFGTGAYGIPPAIVEQEVVPAVRNAASANQLPLIDTNAVFKGHPELVSDNIHPTAAGYKLIAQAVAAFLTRYPHYKTAVSASDTVLQPVVSINRPIVTSYTAYSVNENAGFPIPNTTFPDAIVQFPLYKPYDATDDRWWDNLVAELLQSRMPVVMMENRGSWNLDPNDLTGNGNMNPRRLTKLLAAMNRANANDAFQIGHMVDTPAFTGATNKLHGYPFNQSADLGVQSDWNDIWWLRGIKLFHDTIPPQYWHRINGRPVIQFWNIGSPAFTNQWGNASKLLQFLENKFIATYGEDPLFILDEVWPKADPACGDLPAVLGKNPWFGPAPNTAYKYATHKGFTTGTVVPGYINPAWFEPTSSLYHSPNVTIPRNQGNTLKSGLDAALAVNANLVGVEGWTNTGESAGTYRSLDPDWVTPNQYIEIIRTYNDLRTVSLRLEAEGCDSYSDTTSGNSAGAVFRRSGDLDIRALSGSGWTVTNAAPNEWIQFTDFKFSSGNYKFPIRYSSTTLRTLRLIVDGVALPDVIAPSTGGMDNFSTIYVGSKSLANGKHTFKLVFVDGGVDLDWLFIKKSDSLISFKSQLTGCFLTAEGGGGGRLISNRIDERNWERFSPNALTDVGIINNGDAINLQAYNGLYTTAEYGGGAAVSVNRVNPSNWGTYTIVRVGGAGSLVSGDKVALKTKNGSNYLTVKSDGTVDASGTNIGMGQTFTIKLIPQ